MKFIFLSNQLFDYPLKTNKWHVATRVAERGHDVLFVDPPIRLRKLVKQVVQGRWPLNRLLTQVQPYRRLDPVKGWTLHKVQPSGRVGELTVFTPVTRSVSEQPDLTDFNIRRLRNQKPNFFDGDSVLWVYNPSMLDYVKKIPHKLLVYDCVDDYPSMANYQRLDLSEKIAEQEQVIAEKADLVFATTRFLADKLSAWNNNVHYVGNAGDYNRFAWVQDSDVQNRIIRHSGLLAVHPTWCCGDPELTDPDFRQDDTLSTIKGGFRAIPQPRIGFTGAIDAYKVNLPLLVKIAKEHSDKSLVLIGPQGVADDQPDLSKLRQMGNVHFLDQKPYEQMPAYFSGFDVYIIPYNLNDYTLKGCFPVKFLDALAAGLPTVVTNLPAYQDFAGVCYIAKNDAQFSQLVQKALDENSQERVEARKNVAKENSWDKKVAKMVALVKEGLE